MENINICSIFHCLMSLKTRGNVPSLPNLALGDSTSDYQRLQNVERYNYVKMKEAEVRTTKII